MTDPRTQELRGQIDELKTIGADAKTRDNAITQCLDGITNLTSDIRSQVQTTAAHDQRTYNETLKGLNDRLQKVRLEIAPRRKFAFKPMPKGASAAPALGASESARKDDAATATGSTSGPKSSSITPFDNTLNVIQGPGYVDVGVVLADSKCSVVKCPVPTPSLTIKNMQKTVIMAGPVNGAAHVVRLTDSVLVVSSRQLRMHECRNCDVYLLCSSNPIIEHCSKMRFSPMPDVLGIRAPEGIQKNLWDQVKDFNWLKAGDSPNWSLLGLEHQLGADQWKTLQETEEGDPVDAILTSFRVN
ncbi:MAG: hypothetical protein Q9200_005704 [Gallowayella weberi]